MIHCEKEWIGGDGMTRTVASPNICMNKGDRKQAKRVGEKITQRSAKWKIFDSMILLKQLYPKEFVSWNNIKYGTQKYMKIHECDLN